MATVTLFLCCLLGSVSLVYGQPLSELICSATSYSACSLINKLNYISQSFVIMYNIDLVDLDETSIYQLLY